MIFKDGVSGLDLSVCTDGEHGNKRSRYFNTFRNIREEADVLLEHIDVELLQKRTLMQF